MKWTLLALPAVLASPLTISPRETAVQITDRYLFFTALPTFLQYRAQKNPSTLDWSSDGCTSAPDNPFKFPFEPACQRHDFGYRNYKAQGRFTSDGRYRVDLNFEKDMVYQCEGVSAKKSCWSLAQVYYYAVRAFGAYAKRDESGADAASAVPDEDADDIAAYRAAVAQYEQAVKEDQAAGLLPAL
ncbi:phospholipase A2 [Cordyceps militaris CM01]|uniref:Phospholipase A2 n=2 Tax=Cordyceps militaris TaxID=73501 RepID=G3JH09_CORMM|nr:phospholipase A2 [Cordyceps militaris CM01]ATY59256.1 phospholipase A2 [Cordyceps militaris]EGX91565.1 phospholipase A2 [Cordyceps militaris CM01]